MLKALICVVMITAAPVYAAVQNTAPVIAAPTPAYADLADFALASKVVAHVRIRQAKPLTGALAVGVRPGQQRFLITADVVALLRAPEGQPPEIKYIIDMPLDSRGKAAKLRKAESLVFAVTARPGEWQLVAPKAQIPWSPAAEQTVRAILTEAVRSDAPPLVRGINSAFHSTGSLPGEGETQIFLDSVDNRPASLTIRRQPDQPPSWFVSLGEVVDEGVSQPAPNSLLWYRLACFLPTRMPASVVEGQAESDAAQVVADYALVMSALGRCNRTGMFSAR